MSPWSLLHLDQRLISSTNNQPPPPPQIIRKPTESSAVGLRGSASIDSILIILMPSQSCVPNVPVSMFLGATPVAQTEPEHSYLPAKTGQTRNPKSLFQGRQEAVVDGPIIPTLFVRVVPETFATIATWSSLCSCSPCTCTLWYYFCLK